MAYESKGKEAKELARDRNNHDEDTYVSDFADPFSFTSDYTGKDISVWPAYCKTCGFMSFLGAEKKK